MKGKRSVLERGISECIIFFYDESHDIYIFILILLNEDINDWLILIYANKVFYCVQKINDD